jgi:hypothetical protein
MCWLFTLRFDCFGVWLLLCKIIYVKGVFDKNFRGWYVKIYGLRNQYSVNRRVFCMKSLLGWFKSRWGGFGRGFCNGRFHIILAKLGVSLWDSNLLGVLGIFIQMYGKYIFIDVYDPFVKNHELWNHLMVNGHLFLLWV